MNAGWGEKRRGEGSSASDGGKDSGGWKKVDSSAVYVGDLMIGDTTTLCWLRRVDGQILYSIVWMYKVLRVHAVCARFMMRVIYHKAC